MKKKFLSIVAVILVALSLAAFAACDDGSSREINENVPDKYVKVWDGSFDYDECVKLEKEVGKDLRVLQLTDVHYDMHNDRKRATRQCIRELIEETRPDLITLTGDWASWCYKDGDSSQPDRREGRAREVFDIVDAYGIPWAPVFGNHDAEGDLTKYDYADIFASYENCLFKAGYSNVKGAGNYVIAVTENGKPVQAVFMLDSHSSLKVGSEKYDCIGKTQIEWYNVYLKGLSGMYGGAIPSLLYQHIPLNEYSDAYKAGIGTQDLLLGANREGVYPGYKNTGLFDAIVKGGGTKAVFAGHDHDNSSAVRYKGVVLAYGVQSGWCSEYATGGQKGGLLADLTAGGEVYVTHIYKTRLFRDGAALTEEERETDLDWKGRV